jgi:hypothetical protein
MKTIAVMAVILGTLTFATAQERLSLNEALVYAKAVSADSNQLKGTPIPTDVDIQKPAAVREGDYGGMVLPQKSLTADSLSQAGKDQIMPLGQLWLHKLTPMADGEAVPSSKLRLVTVYADGTETTVPQCVLGLRKNASGALELLVFGKGKEPLLTTPLKAVETKQDLPIDLDGERDYDSGKVTLKILGKYQASFRVTELEG